MKTIEFQTNIMCGSCLAKVTPNLNAIAGDSNWKIDLLNPKKTLTVVAGDFTGEDLVKAVEDAGFKATKVS